MIRLDERLSAISGLVRPGSVVADIGSDHGYLACALAVSGTAARVFACEANPAPFERTKKTIEKNCLSHKVEAVFTNGLTGLPLSVIDTVIIAGMGGDLISEILLSCRGTRDNRFDFILQPMTKPEKLRKALIKNGFGITFERAVISGNKVYTVLLVKYTERIYEPDDIVCYAGFHLGSGQFESELYLRQVIRKLEKKHKGFRKSGNLEEAARYGKVIAEIERGIK